MRVLEVISFQETLFRKSREAGAKCCQPPRLASGQPRHVGLKGLPFRSWQYNMCTSFHSTHCNGIPCIPAFACASATRAIHQQPHVRPHWSWLWCRKQLKLAAARVCGPQLELTTFFVCAALHCLQRVAGSDTEEGGALGLVLPAVCNVIRHGVGLNTKVRKPRWADGLG